MENREKIQVQVGAFVVVGLVLLMTVIFLLGNEKSFFETQYSLVSHFSDISGLRLGAPVQLAGINVGTVHKILFDETLEKKKVKLVLKINKKYQERIRADSEGSIVTQGLLGDKIVFITVGSTDKPVLKDGDELAVGSPSGFFQLLAKGGTLIDSITEVAGNVNLILNEVKHGKGLLHGVIYDQNMMDDIAAMARNAEEASVELEAVIDKVNSGQGTLGALINDATLFNDLKTLLGKANRNKLIRAVVREAMKTREEKTIGESPANP